MTPKAIYTVATLNGFKHNEVIGYIALEFGKTSTKDLNEEEKQSLINYLEDKQMAEKSIYVGSGKRQNGKWIKATLKAEVLNPAHWEEYEGSKFIKINININEEPDKYGKDVSITIDAWKPGKASAPISETAKDFNDSQSASGDSELPF